MRQSGHIAVMSGVFLKDICCAELSEAQVQVVKLNFELAELAASDDALKVAASCVEQNWTLSVVNTMSC